MSSALARVEQPPELAVMTTKQLEFIARTDFIPKGMRGNLPAILACVATGRALGLPDMTALRSIHIIDGKATFSAELMMSLTRRAGHSITGNFGDGSVTLKGKRADTGDEMEVTWTLAMAERAGLLSKTNWQKYPEAMLHARAVSQLCRVLFADVFIGATYTPEELGAHATDENGVPIEDGQVEDWDPSTFPPPDDVPLPPAPMPAQVKATDAQLKKLNVLVGKLRPAKVTTIDLYELTGYTPGEGEIRWSPLRDMLSKGDASALIEKLEQLDKPEPGLSAAQLKKLIKESDIPDVRVKEKAHELFPGVANANALTDQQRGQLWRALAEE